MRNRDKHDCPNGRPIHPNCLALTTHSPTDCSCDADWQGWDGREETRERALAVAARLDSRQQPVRFYGAAADADDGDTGDQASSRGAVAGQMLGTKHFYSAAQAAQCAAGLPMRSDKRGLPPGYAVPYHEATSWDRAKAASNTELPALTTEQHIRSITRTARLREQAKWLEENQK